MAKGLFGGLFGGQGLQMVGKQADFAFEPVTLKMFAHAYKLHCEECKAYEKRNENSQEVSRT